MIQDDQKWWHKNGGAIIGDAIWYAFKILKLFFSKMNFPVDEKQSRDSRQER